MARARPPAPRPPRPLRTRPAGGTATALVVALLVTVLLAGCLGILGPSGDGQDPADADPADEDDGDDWDVDNSSVPVRPGTRFVNGSRPHTHDYWEGQSQRTILDTDLSFNERARGPFRNTFTFHPSSGESVLPGTGEISVTVTWQADADQVHLSYFFPGPQETLQDARWMDNGDEWRIEVDKTGWDVPHARRSLWQFRMGKSPSDVGLTDVHVKIVIHRNATNLPLDPPHFDQFDGADERTVFDGTVEVSDLAPVLNEVRDLPIVRLPEFGQSFDAVPHTAETVVLEVAWETTGATEPRFELTYRTASDLEDREADPGEVGPGGATWTFHPTDREVDSEYAYHSLWELAFWRPTDDPVQHYAPYSDVTFRITMTAYRNGAGP